LGSLTPYLQEHFQASCPRGWRCRCEVPLVDAAAARRLGFEPRADVLLEKSDESKRIWVEFEISRADPVANHAKFATARFFEASVQREAFVSMSSRHIVRGRAALAAGAAMMMRSLGFPAFQVDLLPSLDARAIKRLNAVPRAELSRVAGLDVAPEIERVLAVTDAAIIDGWHRIHKADNHFTVSVNVRRWNHEMTEPSIRARWGRRAVQYYVFDPPTQLFAPAKFCAFVPSPLSKEPAMPFLLVREPPGAMTMDLYASLGEGDPRFDGHVARTHLASRLGYRAMALSSAPVQVATAFEQWHAEWADAVTTRRPTTILFPPD
jgi:hypothetical protein